MFQSDLGEIIPSNIMEENDVYVTGLYLEKLLNPELILNSTQLNTLNDIADQCPLDGGSAVIRARSMLWNPAELQDLHPGATCEGIYGPRSGNSSDDFFEINVLPNPNKGNFVIHINDNSKESNYTIRIHDMNGKMIRTINTSEQKLNLDLGNKTGIFYINVLNQNGVNINKKILTF